MSDRNTVKWMPFNSIIDLSEEIKNLKNSKFKVSKPILCEDEQINLNYSLQRAIQNKENIIIKYYQDGYIHKKMATIFNIKNNKILFKDQSYIYINQILNIKFI